MAHSLLTMGHRIITGLTEAIITNHEFIQKHITLPNSSTRTSPLIESNMKMYPFFKDCIGAVDGTHTPVIVSPHKKAPYVDRQNNISQNVLAACTFNMKYCYVMPGWEGSASDSRLWDDARTKDLTIPPGKYYLGDAGFPLTETCLVPYRAVRYHLKEWEGFNNK